VYLVLVHCHGDYFVVVQQYNSYKELVCAISTGVVVELPLLNWEPLDLRSLRRTSFMYFLRTYLMYS
jgi:hypothetical protein